MSHVPEHADGQFHAMVTEKLRAMLKHIPWDQEQTLSILRGHLLIEKSLSAILNEALAAPQHLRNKRLSFELRLDLIQAMMSSIGDFAEVAKSLNKLRNALAHEMEPKDLQLKISIFCNLAYRLINGAHPENVPQTPLTGALMLSYAMVETYRLWRSRGLDRGEPIMVFSR